MLLGGARDSIVSFLGECARLSSGRAYAVADRLVCQSLEPSFSQALFGTFAVPEEWPDNDAADREVAAAGVRQIVAGCFHGGKQVAD